MEGISTFIVDAFVSETPFSGNPAGVCLLNNNKELSNDLKQKIAAELNLPTTAFAWIQRPDDNFENGKCFGLQWFSPTVEVDLCGHALIALAKVLFDEYENKHDFIRFETPLAGEVQARKSGKEFFSIEFPNQEPKIKPEELYSNLIKISTQDYAYVDVKFSSPTKKILIRFDDSMTRKEFEGLNPSPSKMLEAVQDNSVQGVILTVKASARNGFNDSQSNSYDFASRYFTPWKGINEDHVCGSAHAVLGPYWQEILGTDKELRARQSSKRGGNLLVKVRKDNRVEISGKCRVVFKGLMEL